MSSLALFYHIDTMAEFETKRRSANSDNTLYYTGAYVEPTELSLSVLGTPDLPWDSICFIKDEGVIYYNLKIYGSYIKDYPTVVINIINYTSYSNPELCAKVNKICTLWPNVNAKIYSSSYNYIIQSVSKVAIPDSPCESKYKIVLYAIGPNAIYFSTYLFVTYTGGSQTVIYADSSLQIPTIYFSNYISTSNTDTQYIKGPLTFRQSVINDKPSTTIQNDSILLLSNMNEIGIYNNEISLSDMNCDSSISITPNIIILNSSTGRTSSIGADFWQSRKDGVNLASYYNGILDIKTVNTTTLNIGSNITCDDSSCTIEAPVKMKYYSTKHLSSSNVVIDVIESYNKFLVEEDIALPSSGATYTIAVGPLLYGEITITIIPSNNTTYFPTKYRLKWFPISNTYIHFEYWACGNNIMGNPLTATTIFHNIRQIGYVSNGSAITQLGLAFYGQSGITYTIKIEGALYEAANLTLSYTSTFPANMQTITLESSKYNIYMAGINGLKTVYAV